jgi:hypothetical protein
MTSPKAPASQQQMSEAQRTSLALAQAAEEAEERKADEFPKENGKQTDAGMMYGKFKVGDRMYWADGTPASGD